MATKNNPGKYDCYAKALPDEPMFILLARDPQAPKLIEEWAIGRIHLINKGIKAETDMNMVTEAYKTAEAMREWRERNNGMWRK